MTATKVCFDVLPHIRNLQGTESLSREEVRNFTAQVINSLRLTFADEIRRLLETRTVPVASVEPVRWVESVRRSDTELSVRLAPGGRTFDVTALQHRLGRGKSRADSPFFDEATRIVQQYYGSLPLAYRGEGMRLESLPAAWQAVYFVTAHLEDADPEDLTAARQSAADLALAMSVLLPSELARALGGAPAVVQTTHQDIVRVAELVAARGAQGLSPLLRTSIPNQSDLPLWMNRRFGLEIEFHARDESVRESLKLIETVTESASSIDTPEAWEEAVRQLRISGLDVPESSDDPLENMIALQEEMGEREDGPAFAMLEELHSKGFTGERQIGDYHTAYNRGYREASDAWSFERDTAMFEIVSPILRTGSETWDQIAAVIDTIHRYGGRVDTLTGGHIHLDIADFGTSVAVHQAFISIVQAHQDVLYRLGTNPWSSTGHRGYRAASPLTQPAPGYANLAQIRKDFHHDKLINFESVHGAAGDHLEFRIPDESLNPQIKQVLVTLLQGMADAAFRVAANPGLLVSDVIEASGSHRGLQRPIKSAFHDSTDREWRLYESDSPESTTSLLRLLNLLPLSPEQRDEVLALWSITPWPSAQQTLGHAPTEAHALSNAGPSRISAATEEVDEPVGVVGGRVSHESPPQPRTAFLETPRGRDARTQETLRTTNSGDLAMESETSAPPQETPHHETTEEPANPMQGGVLAFEDDLLREVNSRLVGKGKAALSLEGLRGAFEAVVGQRGTAVRRMDVRALAEDVVAVETTGEVPRVRGGVPRWMGLSGGPQAGSSSGAGHVVHAPQAGSSSAGAVPVPQTVVDQLRFAPRDFLTSNVLSMDLGRGLEVHARGLQSPFRLAFLHALDRPEVTEHRFVLVSEGQVERGGKPVFMLAPAVEWYVRRYGAGMMGLPQDVDRALPAVRAHGYVNAVFVPYRQGSSADPGRSVGHAQVLRNPGQQDPRLVVTPSMNGCAFAVSPSADSRHLTVWHYQSPVSNMRHTADFRRRYQPMDWFGAGEYARGGQLFEATNILWYENSQAGWRILSQENYTDARIPGLISFGQYTGRRLVVDRVDGGLATVRSFYQEVVRGERDQSNLSFRQLERKILESGPLPSELQAYRNLFRAISDRMSAEISEMGLAQDLVTLNAYADHFKRRRRRLEEHLAEHVGLAQATAATLGARDPRLEAIKKRGLLAEEMVRNFVYRPASDWIDLLRDEYRAPQATTLAGIYLSKAVNDLHNPQSRVNSDVWEIQQQRFSGRLGDLVNLVLREVHQHRLREIVVLGEANDFHALSQRGFSQRRQRLSLDLRNQFHGQQLDPSMAMHAAASAQAAPLIRKMLDSFASRPLDDWIAGLEAELAARVNPPGHASGSTSGGNAGVVTMMADTSDAMANGLRARLEEKFAGLVEEAPRTADTSDLERDWIEARLNEKPIKDLHQALTRWSETASVTDLFDTWWNERRLPATTEAVAAATPAATAAPETVAGPDSDTGKPLVARHVEQTQPEAEPALRPDTERYKFLLDVGVLAKHGTAGFVAQRKAAEEIFKQVLRTALPDETPELSVRVEGFAAERFDDAVKFVKESVDILDQTIRLDIGGGQVINICR
ncbi:amidoligase family protein [Actinacidiphila glaucinigra]|uniref:amidoligase family protein n=1 Tax=Actinacidiphila glaucinigra TaxID=235986 RepID=UPI003D8EB42E